MRWSRPNFGLASVASASILLCLVGRADATREEVRVTGDRVNLRAGPGLKYEVVGQLSRGDVLAVGTREGDWAEVSTPEHVDLWVYGELVKEGVVAVSRLRVRGGPGINYKPVARLEKGDRVTVRGEKGDWVKIAPPPGATLWISCEYVRLASETHPVPAVTRPIVEKRERTVSPPSRPKKPVVVAKTPPAPKPSTATGEAGKPEAARPRPAAPSSEVLLRRKLVPSGEQGRFVDVAGALRRAGWVWNRPSGYRLVKHDNRRRPFTVCYVLGDAARLDPLVGRSLRISGRRYWVQGVRYPVVAPQTITAVD